MKKRYIKPIVEIFEYEAEKGYRVSVALDKDYVLIEGDGENRTLRASEDLTEYTDETGEYTNGIWVFD